MTQSADFDRDRNTRHWMNVYTSVWHAPDMVPSARLYQSEGGSNGLIP